MPIIVDGNKIIDTPVPIIIENLKNQLDALHIDKLRDIQYKGNNVVLTCPNHKDGRESTPACNVLIEDKDGVSAGTAYCFACGYKAGMVKFIADCLSISYRDATEWLLGFADYTLIGETRNVDFNLEDKVDENNYDELPTITLEELRSYDYTHPYMYKRKLTDEIIYKFEVGYDPKSDCITFPVYQNGRCLFVAKRAVKYKRFFMPQIHPKPLYGVDYIDSSPLIVCESIFNALTCWVYGKQAIALFGTGSKEQIEMINKLPNRSIILALDGDNAGKNGMERLKRGIKNKFVSVLKVPEGKDINDLTKEEFDNLEEEF